VNREIHLQGITSPPGDKFHPWGTTSPLGSKLAPRSKVKNATCDYLIIVHGKVGIVKQDGLHAFRGFFWNKMFFEMAGNWTEARSQDSLFSYIERSSKMATSKSSQTEDPGSNPARE
jgi:hypothetical protein